jgi:hypothetical protein
VCALSTLGVFFIGPFFEIETIRSGTPVSMSKLTKMDKAIRKECHTALTRYPVGHG